MLTHLTLNKKGVATFVARWISTRGLRLHLSLEALCGPRRASRPKAGGFSRPVSRGARPLLEGAAAVISQTHRGSLGRLPVPRLCGKSLCHICSCEDTSRPTAGVSPERGRSPTRPNVVGHPPNLRVYPDAPAEPVMSFTALPLSDILEDPRLLSALTPLVPHSWAAPGPSFLGLPGAGTCVKCPGRLVCRPCLGWLSLMATSWGFRCPERCHVPSCSSLPRAHVVTRQ